MKTTDQRIVWKDKNVLELLVLINGFIDAHEISTVRDYQKKLRIILVRLPVYGI